MSIFLSFACPKERNKEKDTTKTKASLLFRTIQRINAEQLAVRTFRGHPSHLHERQSFYISL
jgi:hypothetical protein